jgi:hypothetical protein
MMDNYLYMYDLTLQYGFIEKEDDQRPHLLVRCGNGQS